MLYFVKVRVRYFSAVRCWISIRITVLIMIRLFTLMRIRSDFDPDPPFYFNADPVGLFILTRILIRLFTLIRIL
jgi:hypothetical protein